MLKIKIPIGILIFNIRPLKIHFEEFMDI